MDPEEEADAAAVRLLEASWEKIYEPDAEAEAELKELVAEWGDAKELDPIVIPVDLLSPLGFETKETAHTQVLSFLLDPAGSHGFDDSLLTGFVEELLECLGESDASRLRSAIGDELSSATVFAERAALATSDDGEEQVAGRTDLWVEVPDEKPRAIIVVELKIDAEVRPGQLATYDAFIEERVQGMDPSPVVARVHLSPDGRSPFDGAKRDGWVDMALRSVAIRWAGLLDNSTQPGASYLRLYLATLFQRLVGIRWTGTPSRIERALLADYLRLRLGKEAE